MSATDEPLDTEIRNDRYDDFWTCPGCYDTLGSAGLDDTVTCGSCGRSVHCTHETFTSCVATLVSTELDEDEDEICAS